MLINSLTKLYISSLFLFLEADNYFNHSLIWHALLSKEVLQNLGLQVWHSDLESILAQHIWSSL